MKHIHAPMFYGSLKIDDDFPNTLYEIKFMELFVIIIFWGRDCFEIV